MISIAFFIIVGCFASELFALKENSFKNFLNRQKRSVIVDQSSKWPGGIVPYQFIPGNFRIMTTSEMEAAKKAMLHIQNQTCIQFIPRTNEQTYLKIERADMEPCQSPVGYYSAGIDSLKFGGSCMQLSVMVHELLHVLGFGHEHQRIDRNKYIVVNYTNVQSGFTNQFDLDNPTYYDTQDIPYDINSIMHYQNFVFSKFLNSITNSIVNEKDFMTMYALSTYTLPLGNNYGLASSDILRIALRYNCSISTTNPAEVSTVKLTTAVSTVTFTSNARVIFSNIIFIYCLIIFLLI